MYTITFQFLRDIVAPIVKPDDIGRKNILAVHYFVEMYFFEREYCMAANFILECWTYLS